MSFQPWANPDPQSIAGLNSAMVYGENIQCAVGLNHQIALGSNLQFCINPSVLFDMLKVPGSATLSSFFGTGLGGNMQFTIGSNTTVSWGRQYEITLGPEKIEINANQHQAFAIVMCSLIGIACIVYAVAYGIITDEDQRATLITIFQITIDLLLAVFMIQLMYYKTIEQGVSDGIRRLAGTGSDIPHSTTLEDFASGFAAVVALGALIVPPVAAAATEGHFQGETQSA